MQKSSFFLLLLAILSLAACKNQGGEATRKQEDQEAKKLLQGIWLYEDGETAFMANGDSIFFPDTTSLPVQFWIANDSIYLKGNHVCHSKITAQAAHLFKIANPSGDEIKVTKTSNNALRADFLQARPYALNTFRTFDSDTVVSNDMGFFDTRIHVETTSDQVIRSSYNGQGIEVDNMYLDNVARITTYNHGKLVYSHDFRKAEFSELVPADFLEKCILRGITFSHAAGDALYYDVSIGIPDASTTYVIALRINSKGKVEKKLK